MTVQQLSKRDGFKALSLPVPDRKISGAYIGDLLSWVMGRASEGDAWITIMSNANILAVATLADVACIILAEGVTPDSDVLSVAETKGINVITSDASAYEISQVLSAMGI